jgi:hypothetical protein
MTASHNQAGIDLAFAIMQQLDRSEYTVRVDSARAKRSHETYDIPDVLVVPTRLVAPQLGRTDTLEVYEEPLPLVAEIRSPTQENGSYTETISRGGVVRLHALPYVIIDLDALFALG